MDPQACFDTWVKADLISTEIPQRGAYNTWIESGGFPATCRIHDARVGLGEIEVEVLHLGLLTMLVKSHGTSWVTGKENIVR